LHQSSVIGPDACVSVQHKQIFKVRLPNRDQCIRPNTALRPQGNNLKHYSTRSPYCSSVGVGKLVAMAAAAAAMKGLACDRPLKQLVTAGRTGDGWWCGSHLWMQYRTASALALCYTHTEREREAWRVAGPCMPPLLLIGCEPAQHVWLGSWCGSNPRIKAFVNVVHPTDPRRV
jgi:hypothetical protein